MGLILEPNFKQKSYIKGYVFNDKHIAFNSNNTNFLSNHLKYDEINNLEINNISSTRLNYINRLIVYTNLNRLRPSVNYIENVNINVNINDSDDDSNSDSDDTISQNNLSNHYDEDEDEDDEDDEVAEEEDEDDSIS
jgi:hypothetical protein